MKNMSMISSAALIVAGGLSAQAAETISHQMTCDQAVSHYESASRINVQVNKKDIVPVYLGKPMSRSASVYCSPKSSRGTYTVKTSDSKHCAISVYCL